MYGDNWRARLAAGLGICRTTLWAIMSDARKRGPQADIDGALIELVDRECEASAKRGASLSRLRNRLLTLREGN
jgi:hypothetical protein